VGSAVGCQALETVEPTTAHLWQVSADLVGLLIGGSHRSG